MITRCNKCQELFDYWEEGAGGWGSRNAEDIDCPHCGQVHGRQVTAGYFKSVKLTEQQLDDYYAAHPAERPAAG